MLAVEWRGYMDQRQGLRVSTAPEGRQRASYFLQIPYKFALPLMGLSSLLHWLASQSMFVVNVRIDHTILDGTPYASYYNATSYNDKNGILNYITCGYSPVPILCISTIAISMLAVSALIRLRKFTNTMPIAGSCSAAISAACHLEEDEDREETALMPIKWGAVGEEKSVEGIRSRVGHCAFSGKEVGVSKISCLYAGIMKEGD